MRRALMGTIVGVVATLGLAGPAAAVDRTNSDRLQELVRPDGVMQHARALQDIAIRNGGNRAALTPGYQASINYVVGRLRNAGYKVTLKPFDLPAWTQNGPATFAEVSPTARTWVEGEDYVVSQYSAGADITAQVVPTNDLEYPAPGGAGTSTSGCEASDYPENVRGNIVLVQRGTCAFTDKFEKANAAGAAGVLIMNDGFEGRTNAIAITAEAYSPAVAMMISSAAGTALLDEIKAGQQVTARIAVDATTTPNIDYNVIADSPTGRKDRTIVVGSHLDGADISSGMSDNASGASATLEIAEAISELGVNPRNRIRFAFWGGEEVGLVGSKQYVRQLVESGEIDQIEANLNYDMLGSVNFARFIYDGDGSTYPLPAEGVPDGSAQIEDVFVKYFREQGMMTDPTPFDGRSDYAEFILNGVPGGGLFTGAEDVKNSRQESDYGGVAGMSFDPCYHSACDTYFNLSRTALDQMSDAGAHAAWTLARSNSPITKWQSRQPARVAKAKKVKRSKRPMAYRGPFRVR